MRLCEHATYTLHAEEAQGADVERGDAEEPAQVEGVRVLEDLGDGGHGQVDWVGNDEDMGAGRFFADCLGEVTHDGHVGIEEVVAGHPGLSWYTHGYHDDFDVLEGGVQGVRWVACCLRLVSWYSSATTVAGWHRLLK